MEEDRTFKRTVIFCHAEKIRMLLAIITKFERGKQMRVSLFFLWDICAKINLYTFWLLCRPKADFIAIEVLL